MRCPTMEMAVVGCRMDCAHPPESWTIYHSHTPRAWLRDRRRRKDVGKEGKLEMSPSKRGRAKEFVFLPVLLCSAYGKRPPSICGEKPLASINEWGGGLLPCLTRYESTPTSCGGRSHPLQIVRTYATGSSLTTVRPMSRVCSLSLSLSLSALAVGAFLGSAA